MERGGADESATGAPNEVRLRGDYCVFVRSAATFAISTRIAREVLDWRPFTPVPRGPNELLGAFNLRGEVVPLVMLEPFLGLTERPFERSDSLLILSGGDLTIAAIVDRVEAIRHIAPWEIQRPEIAARDRNSFLRGTLGKDAQHLLVLDGDRLLAAVAASIAQDFRRRYAGSAKPVLERGRAAEDAQPPSRAAAEGR